MTHFLSSTRLRKTLSMLLALVLAFAFLPGAVSRAYANPDPLAPVAPEYSSVDSESVSIPGTAGQEYVICEAGTSPDWTLAVTPVEIDEYNRIVDFYHLTPATEYDIWYRVAATEEHEAGPAESLSVVTTLESWDVSGSFLIGDTVALSVEPEDAEGLSYQWHYLNVETDEGFAQYTLGDPIPGATDKTLLLPADAADRYIGVVITKGTEEIARELCTNYPVSYGTVVFDAAGGTDVPTVTGLVYGDPVSEPEEPTREGYAFDGWWTYDYDLDEEVEWDFATDTIVSQYTYIEAKWTPYAVLPETSAVDQTRIQVSAVEGQEYALVPRGETPDWTLAKTPADGEDTVLFEDLTPATLYTLYVRVAANGEEPASEAAPLPFITSLYGVEFQGDLFVGSTLTVVPDPEDATGLTYQWHHEEIYEDENGTTSFYYPIDGADSASYTATAEDVGERLGFTIYKNGEILWEEPCVYDEPVEYGTVVFQYADDATEDVELTGYAYGDLLTTPTEPEEGFALPEDPEREGYLFGGWYYDIDMESELKVDPAVYTVTTSYQYLIAKWLSPANLTVEAEEGYEYVIAPKGEDPDWTGAVAPTEDGNGGYYVHFDNLSPATEYEVHKRPAGSDEAGTATEYTTDITAYGVTGEPLLGAPLTVSVEAELSGLTYQWLRGTEAEGEEGPIVTYEEIPGATDLTYETTADDLDKYIGYRVYKGDTMVCEYTESSTPVSYGTVSFDSNGGSSVEDATGFAYGDVITEPDQPTRTDYEFAGWYTADDWEWNFEFDTVEFLLTELTARWEPLDVAYVAPEAPAALGTEDPAVTVTDNGDGTMTVNATANGEPVDGAVKVELPAPENGSVLVIVKPDGTEEIVKKSLVEGDTVYAEIPAGSTVKVIESDVAFGDVAEEDWYAETVAFVTSHELFEGTGNDEFSPELPMTRAMMATVLFRLEGAEPTDFAFDDVEGNEWYADAASWAGDTGIVEGTDNGFDGEKPVTREQIAVMLYRYAMVLGLDTTERSDLSAYSDGAETSGWAAEAFRWAVAADLFEGYGDGTLNPKGEATRAEAATVLMRLVGLIVR